MKNYYVFDIEDNNKYYSEFVDRPMRIDGEGLLPYDENISLCILKLPKARNLPDVIGAMGGIFVLSERAHTEISKLRLPSKVVHVPINIETKEGIIRSYALTWDENIKVLDLEKSSYRWLVPDKLIGITGVTRWVLDSNRIPNLDLFNPDNEEWIVSQQFYDMFQKHSFTGAKFSQCEIS